MRAVRGQPQLALRTLEAAKNAGADVLCLCDTNGGTLPGQLVEIVRMVSQGLRNKAIGDRLSISEGTVKVHLHNIYEKLGVDGRLELVIVAQQRGIS